MAQVSHMSTGPNNTGMIAQATSQDLVQMLTVAHMQYSSGRYTDALHAYRNTPKPWPSLAGKLED